ncbi:hypothetical protein CALVIDRAFT_568331 [Calocera viscosa TUFC12733]|uniref:Uncharacterized protein n=1 Tax=Calocera viscosa (strain TUFC12733) TaxID=1330018 RepID=A0A167H6P2_CALVF|nr:hypothetical protein CALVIDRAFT_568331 [Calocera viscosa TUFC12733]
MALTTANVVVTCNNLVKVIQNIPHPIVTDFLAGGGNSWQYPLESMITAVNMVVADFVLIYRAWIVWNRSWLTITFNILVWLGNIATTIRLLQLLVHSATDPNDVPTLISLNQWSLTNMALAFVQNITATGLIALRLWQVDRNAGTYKTTSFTPIIRIVVESGLMYTSLLLTNVLVYGTSAGPGNLLVSALIDPMIVMHFLILFAGGIRGLNSSQGVAFSLIIVRVGLGLSPSNDTVARSRRITTVHNQNHHEEDTVRGMSPTDTPSLDSMRHYDVEMNNLKLGSEGPVASMECREYP